MVAIPMRLEDALRFNGYTIAQTDVEASDIVVPTGTIHIPAMRLSSLSWKRPATIEWPGGPSDPDDPEPRDSFYLAALPVFAEAYRPVILSHILDRYSTRRIGYNTPDQFGLAVRRWANLHLGPESVLNRMYLSTAVTLPLDTQDATTAATSADKSRDATSDFPQVQLGGNVDYGSFATDRAAESTSSTAYTGRLGRSVADLLVEQREAYLNADAMLLDQMDDLFLGVWDRDEGDLQLRSPISAVGFLPGRW